jgi:hypothetical protein
MMGVGVISFGLPKQISSLYDKLSKRANVILRVHVYIYIAVTVR